jgi:proteasome lid subunit RPN8/RPN11
LTGAGLPQVPGSGAALERLLLCMEAAWPHEACGALFVSLAGAWEWHPMENVADRSGQAFVFGEAWLGLLRREEKRHSRLACLAHSHPDGEARLSRADIQSMAPGGTWLWPGVMQMVVAVEKGGWRELSWFTPKGAGFECLGSLKPHLF